MRLPTTPAIGGEAGEFGRQLIDALVCPLAVTAQPGYSVTLGEAWRPPETQELYVKQGKSWTENSRHLVRLAIDLNLFINDEWKKDPVAFTPLGKYWESLHPDCRWGGRWRSTPDANHFELMT